MAEEVEQEGGEGEVGEVEGEEVEEQEEEVSCQCSPVNSAAGAAAVAGAAACCLLPLLLRDTVWQRESQGPLDHGGPWKRSAFPVCCL